MPEIETWWAYVERITKDAPQKDIAKQAGVDGSSVSRWSQGVTPKADAAVKFARAYNRPPIEALITSGYIRPDEVGGAVEVSISMGEVADSALIEELASRLDAFRRLAAGHDSENWPPPTWQAKDSRMGGEQDR